MAVIYWASCRSLSCTSRCQILEGVFEFGRSRQHFRDRHCAPRRPRLSRSGKPGESDDRTSIKACTICIRSIPKERSTCKTAIRTAIRSGETVCQEKSEAKIHQIACAFSVSIKLIQSTHGLSQCGPPIRAENKEPGCPTGARGAFPAPKLDKPLAAIFTWLGIPILMAVLSDLSIFLSQHLSAS